MNIAQILAKEKIVSLSEIQRNPGKALSGEIVRIVKNGKEIGIFLSKKQCEDIFPFQKSNNATASKAPYNWSTDETALKKDKNTYAAWKLEQMINYGLNGGKISEKTLRKYRKKLKLDPDRAKFVDFLLQ